MLNNQSLWHGFEVVYLDNIVGPCYRWVWALECWNFFSGLLTYESTWGCQQSEVILLWGQRLPEIVWELWAQNQIQPVTRVTNFLCNIKNIIFKFWIFIIFGIPVLCSVQTVHVFMLLFSYRLYWVYKSHFLKHSQAASGLKIKWPQIKNCWLPQVDTYVRRPGKNFQHSRTQTQR